MRNSFSGEVVSTRSRRLYFGASISILAALAAGPALAQADPTPASDTAQVDKSSSDIVVTGSRVISNGDNSPTPLTVVSSQMLLQTTPTTIADALRKLPVFSNSNNSTTLGNSGGNNVGNFVNLRGFGAVRTLVLLDGKRLTPSNASGLVDTNVIPEMLLQRVDIVTGGASAVYGSDAVTGVVNYVLDKKFTGLKLQAQSGISQQGDGMSWRGGAAWGTNLFDGRGHFEVSYEHFTQEGIDSKLARRNGRLVYSEEGAGTAANPFMLVANTRGNNSSFGGLILSGPLADMQFAGNGGTLVPFAHGAPTGSAGIESGGDGSYLSRAALTAGLKTDRIFGRFDYDITDNIGAYAQANWARSENSNTFINFVLAPGLTTISATNPYLSPAVQAQLAGSGGFLLGRVYDDVPGIQTRSVTRDIEVSAGLEGDLGERFKWNLFYTHGESKQQVSSIGNINLGRLAAALDTVNVNGTIQCRANTGAYAGCVPFDPFVSGPAAGNAINYVRGTTRFDLTNKLDDVGGTLSGSPFDTWAGPVKVALSGEYRHISLRNVSNAQPSEHPDCTGIALGCNTAFPLWLSNTVGDAKGRQSVAEGAIEANVPLLRDVRFVKSLDLNGAFRYTHYSTSGGAVTWKVGAGWHVDDAVSFRATRSRDIRAPNLNDLFAPVNSSQTGFTDSHTNTAGLVTVVTQGNPNLKPEVAQTWTVGMVLTPMPRLSLSIDYFNIKIANAITGVGGNDATSLRICEDSGGTSPVCALYVRPLPFSDTSPANYPTMILSQGLNIASSETKGIDSEVNYTLPLAGESTLDFRGLLTWQPTLKTTLFGTTINSAGAAGQQGVLGQAKWRATLFVSYHSDHWGVDIQERWRSSLNQSGNTALVFATPKVPAAAFTDLTLTAHPGGSPNRTVFFSVQNLLNKTSPVFISPAFASNPGFYYPAANDDDVLGRYFTFGVRLKF